MSELVWRKSSRSPSQQCVEMAHVQADVLVRDSKQADHGPQLRFSARQYRAFLDMIKSQDL